MWLLAALISGLAGAARAQSLTGVGFDESLDEPAGVADALDAAALAPDAAFLLRIRVPRTRIESAPGTFDLATLDARLERYAARPGMTLLLDLGPAVSAGADLDAWRRYVREVTAHARGRVRGYVVHAPAAPVSAADAAFAIKAAAVAVKAGDDRALVVLGTFGPADADRLTALFDLEIAAYVEAGLTAAAVDGGLDARIDQRAPSTPWWHLDQALAAEAPAAADAFLTRHLELLGSKVSAAIYAGPPPAVAAVLPVASRFRFLVDQPTAALDDAAIALRITRNGRDATASVPHRMLFGLKTAANALVYRSAEGPLDITVTERTGVTPSVVDARAGTRRPVERFAYDAAKATARFTVPAAPTPLVVDWSDGTGTVLVESEDVATAKLPSVAEIIARHQQAQGAQDALVRRYVVNATMTQSFRTTQADPGWDVVTENRYFVDGTVVEWEEREFRLNGTRWGANRPPFPLLQAEKVLSLPLDLRLTADYRYVLDGVERVEGRDCFVLHFDPVDAAKSLYKGTVWIDRRDFLKVKVQTVQTRMTAPVLSSEETQYFTSVGQADGRDVQRLTRLVGRQTMLVAGRTLAVERLIGFHDHQLNPADFEAQRQTARDGSSIMYRDTDQGLRYFAKKDGVRQVVDSETTKAKALALGVTYDPSFDFPLPLGGINYLDFNFLGKDNQLAVVFGGVLALVNVQRPNLVGRRVGASLDLFAIAVPGNDRTYGARAETPGERVVTIPFTTGLNVYWQMTEFQRITASYQFRYDHFGRDALTDPAFTVPASGVTNGAGLAWDWKRAGYSLVVGATAYTRATWTPWGAADDYRPGDRDYVKYSASLTRDWVFGIQKVHLNAAYYGGSDLDRFSKYQFGFFDDNRIHGVPASGLRFGDLGMFRGSYSFNLFEQYRLDLFLDHALGRDTAISPAWQHVTGLGLGFNVRGPKGTMLRGDLGKGLVPDRYRKPGTLVFQFQVLKPL
ncbi:MAG: sigma-E factor regulatory protein RseB domain-containing protein [Vicinamibacterales bacterium]